MKKASAATCFGITVLAGLAAFYGWQVLGPFTPGAGTVAAWVPFAGGIVMTIVCIGMMISPETRAFEARQRLCWIVCCLTSALFGISFGIGIQTAPRVLLLSWLMVAVIMALVWALRNAQEQREHPSPSE